MTAKILPFVRRTPKLRLLSEDAELEGMIDLMDPEAMFRLLERESKKPDSAA
jgi:hypothetical protein